MTRISDRRCPRCKQAIQLFVEVWAGESILFDADNLDDGSLEQTGSPTHVEAICSSCSHQWRLRGVRSIQQLRDEREVSNG